MSKIGQKPIPVPSAVQVEIKDRLVEIKGAKGQLSIDLPVFLKIKNENGILILERKNDLKKQKSAHGLFRSILANAVKGVSEGWFKKLEIVGTGFSVKPQGQGIALKLGFSHMVEFPAPEGIQLTTEENNFIIISGADRQRVGEVAHQIRSIKEPDHYKGKGIRYFGEHIKLKPGKKVKAA